MNKFDRQGAILRLVQERSLATQSELAEALREAGIETVQVLRSSPEAVFTLARRNVVPGVPSTRSA